MAFWSSQKIRARQSISGREIIGDGFNEDRIKSSSYELEIGEYVYLTDSVTKSVKETKLDPSGTAEIPQGQFAIISTEERVNLPADCMGFISMKTSHKMKGLVNVSGFHVDPGYNNYLKFGVYNAGPKSITVKRGEAFFLIFFADLDTETEKPYENKKIDPTIHSKWHEGLKGGVDTLGDFKNKIDDLDRYKDKAMLFVSFVIGAIAILGLTKYIESEDLTTVKDRISNIEMTMRIRAEVEEINKELLKNERIPSAIKE